MKKLRLKGNTGITLTSAKIYGKIDGVGKEVLIYVKEFNGSPLKWGDSFSFNFQILDELKED